MSKERTDMPHGKPESASCDEKEVYAFYGLASYYAQVAEREVMMLGLLCRMRDDPGRMRNTFEEEYELVAMRTFGQNVQALLGREFQDADLPAHLQRATRVRNKLTHHFFWDRAEDFFGESGRQQMIGELIDSATYLSDVAERVEATSEKLWSELGVDPRRIDTMFDRLLQEARKKFEHEDFGV